MGLFGKKRAAGSCVAVGEGAFAGAALFGAADSLASGGALSDVEFRHVCKAYGANEVLRRVTFTLPGGGVRCLMAPSGSGKTTLFRVLLGLERADSGEIRGISPGRISMMFQEDRLCETLTPVENVALVLPAETRRADVAALLAEDLADGLPGAASHGAFRWYAPACVASACRCVPERPHCA